MGMYGIPRSHGGKQLERIRRYETADLSALAKPEVEAFAKRHRTEYRKHANPPRGHNSARV